MARRKAFRASRDGRWISRALEFLGRADQQLKIRGFRVEPGEIEAFLLRHPSVAQAVVLPREDRPGEKRLLGYVVPVPGQQLELSALRSHLSIGLPDYMVPSTMVILEALPLTANGKLDRKALLQLQPIRRETLSESATPWTDAERQLAQIWQNALNLESVGLDDSFFDLGGDSILILQVVAAARAARLHFSTRDLYGAPTIRGLARKMDSLKAAEEPAADIAPFSLVSASDRTKLPTGLEDAYPLARLQAGMFFHAEFEADSAIFHDISSFRLRLPFEHQLMDEVLQNLVLQHPILRTSFHWEDLSEPLQFVHPFAGLPLTVDHLDDLSQEQQKAAKSSWFEREKQNPFDIAKAPLARLHIHHFSPNELQLNFSCHHAILDGWSLATFLAELMGAYLARLEGRDPVIAKPKTKFRDYILLERQAIESAASRSYWRERVADLMVNPIVRPSSLQEKGKGRGVGMRTVEVTEQCSSDLEQVTRQIGVPLKSVLLAAHLRVLGLLSGTNDVVTGLVMNGRPESADSRNALGLFLNTVPFRLSIYPESWREFIQRVFEAEQNLLPHGRFPLPEIYRLSSSRRLYDVGFNFTHFHVYRALLQSNQVEVLDVAVFEQNDFTFVANFSVDPVSRRVALSLNYSLEEFSAEHVARIGDYYLRALHSIGEAPESQSGANLLSPEERRELLVEWNATAREVPEVSLSELFEEQVAGRPDAVALEHGGSLWSYQRLNQRVI